MISRRFFFALPLLLSRFSEQPRSPLSPGNYHFSNVSSDLTGYHLHIPPDWESDRLTSLVIVLPDGRNSARDTLRKSGWDKQGDRVCVLTATPEAVTTNALVALLHDLASRVKLDTGRIYVISTPEQAEAFVGIADRIAALAFTGGIKNLPIALTNTPIADRTASDPSSLWRFFDHHPRIMRPVHSTKLLITCTGLRNHQGQVMVSLFNQSKGFPDKDEMAFRTATAPVRDDKVTVAFPDLPPGDYACVFIHDENGNNQFDTSLGYPLEGFGTSNNPKFRFGPPKYDDAVFSLAGDVPERRIVLRASYL